MSRDPFFPDAGGPTRAQRAAIEAREASEVIAKLHGLLDCRAGHLLVEGKPFIVVSCTEPYYASVYSTIREHEKAAGTWTDECEAAFLDQCPHADEGKEVTDER